MSLKASSFAQGVRSTTATPSHSKLPLVVEVVDEVFMLSFVLGFIEFLQSEMESDMSR